MAVPRGHICARIGSELVDYRNHPDAAYLRNIEVAPGMTDNQRVAMEQEGVVFPVMTAAYRAEVERVLQLLALRGQPGFWR
jgi:hypothetical protein